jgi:anti-sigma factor RsiW
MNGHLGDLVSALVDGELTTAETDQARAHLAECAHCRAELQATERTRALINGLPLLDPPFGVIERSRRAARRPRPFAWAASAAAAAAVAGLFTVSGSERVTPPVADFVEVHATSSVNGDPLSNLAPVVLPVSFSE